MVGNRKPYPAYGRLIPFLIGILSICITASLWRSLSAREFRQIHERLALEAQSVLAFIEEDLENRFQELERMAQRWTGDRELPRPEWELDTQYYLQQQPSAQAIAWIDEHKKPRWIQLSDDTRPDLKHTLRSLVGEQFAQANRHLNKGNAVSPPIRLFENQKGFIIFVPVHQQGTLRGTVGVCMNVEEWLREVSEQKPFSCSIAFIHNQQSLFESVTDGPILQGSRWLLEEPISLHNVTWILKARPTTAMVAQTRSSFPKMVLGIGLTLSLLLALCIRLAQTSQENASALQRINQELQEEIQRREAIEQELHVAHDRLEKRVKERTQELQEANLRLQEDEKEKNELILLLAQSNDRFKHLNERLERSNQDLHNFAQVASHDLQEPLRMVASFLQLLEKRYQDQLDEKAGQFIHYAIDGAVRMQEMITALVAYSRVESKGKPFEYISGDEALAEALQNLQIAIGETRASVTYDPLPKLHGDRIQLVQLFQNLISNAIKFRGDTAPAIHVSAKKASTLPEKNNPESHQNVLTQGTTWIISIRDNGIGIDPEYYHRIFVIFQRLHVKNQYAGSGIGLAICKRIVERHAGRIWVESLPGRGSTFFFTVPGHSAHEQAA